MMTIRTLALTAGAALSLAACADGSPVAARADAAAPLLAAGAGGLGGSYVVVLDEDADARAVAAAAGVSPRYLYTAAVNGFAATLNAGQLTALRHYPGVAFVEQDQAFRITATQSGAPWNLDRIDQRGPVGSGSAYTPVYTYRGTASTVYAYVIDTGINTTHTQFGGRASIVYDALGGNGQDCNGHGTAVASILGGSTYGVAKGVRLRGLRVTDCAGSAATSAIIAAVDWVRLNRTNPAVANLSLSGGLSSALNTAVNNLANSGVFISVAAGNNNADACGFSPASAASAMTVMASTRTDARASYSNYGSCTDMYAPGDSIPTATGIRSGTSMAAPHAAGVAALYKATYGNASTATVTAWIKNNATPNAISGNPAGTPNLLLYTGGL